MKFENIYIEYTCDEQRDLIFKKLDDMGYKFMNNVILDVENCVGAYDDGDYQTLIGKGIHFHEFMSKYSNQFHDKIKKAMSDFGLGREELSRKLGYSDPYITKMLTLPQSEKVKKKVSEKIELLYVNQDIESDASIQVAAIQKENEQLKKELDHKNQVLDKRNDFFKDAEYEIASLNKTIESLQIVLNEKTTEINDLSKCVDGLQSILGCEVVAATDKKITELENLNKQLGIDLSKRNKDVNLLNFGCVVLGLIVLIVVCFW